MSEVLGPRCFGNDQSEVFLGRDFSSSQDYSEEIAAKIDSEIHEIISGAYDKAKTILTDNIAKLHFIAEFLIKHELMDGDQFKAIMESEFPVMEEIEAIAEAKRQKSIKDNEERMRLQEEKARLEAEKKAAEEAEAKANENAEVADEGKNPYSASATNSEPNVTDADFSDEDKKD